MRSLPKCPYHGTELVISGNYLLTCKELIYKGKKGWRCEHKQYSHAELPFIQHEEEKKLDNITHRSYTHTKFS